MQLKEKQINFLYLILSLIIIIVLYIVNLNFRDKLETIALSESFFWLLVPVFVFSSINMIFKKSPISNWIMFTKYYIPICAILVVITPTSTNGMDFIPLVKETLTITFSAFYSLTSFYLIFLKTIN